MVTLTDSRRLRSPVNRRTLLGAAGGVSAFGLVSYFIYAFSLSMPVILTGINETDEPKGLVVTVNELETNQTVFDDPITVPVGGTTQIGRVPNADAQVAVKLVELTGDGEAERNEDAVVEEQTTLVGTDTKQLSVTIADDGLSFDQTYRS